MDYPILGNNPGRAKAKRLHVGGVSFLGKSLKIKAGNMKVMLRRDGIRVWCMAMWSL